MRCRRSCGMIEHMSEEPLLPEEVDAWVQDQADRHYGGDFGRTVAAYLEAAYTAAQEPENAWAFQEKLLQRRTKS